MPGMNLTRDEARQRAQLVSVDSYDVDLDLTGTGPTFSSRTVVRFDCAQPGASTFIDLVAPEVHSVVLNGRTLPAEAADGVRIQLDGLGERNVLEVHADCRYMNTGEGLHRFVDPVDGQTYLYTQFEVSDSRRVFAVFEQPDLKATFRFTVTAPEHWQVVSNAPTPAPEPVADGVARWAFPPTRRIASYITALVAGPYHAVRSELASADGRRIPLGVFVRASLANFLKAEEIFDVTRAGFAYYEDLFGRPYPFDKYDQLFVPEYNAGAMENAGAVTILEDYVFRSRVPDAMYERRANTILHELAHMWFGDLVTMRWWDDLWLNESFASYMSVLCQAEATPWPQAWTTFANAEKSWAYRQDALPSTHPISADIRDLEDVEVNFDGITYAKGAAVLKQLVAWVGRDAFAEGLRAYFDEFAWSNATLSDLLDHLEATSGRDLSAWAKDWLQTAGTNTLQAQFATDGQGRFTSFEIRQTAPADHPTLRPHRLAVGLYDRVDGRLTRTGRVELDVTGPLTPVPELIGRAQPDLVLVNDDDLTFAKVRLDPRSLATVTGSIGAFTDSLPRTLCWAAAWDMTRDAQMRARDFINLVLGGIAAETDSTVVLYLLRQLATAAQLYTAPADRPAILVQVADGLERALRTAPPGSDHQLQYARALAGFARTPEQLDLLAGLRSGEETLPGLVVDTDLRWTLLHRLVAMGRAGDAEIEEELARDDTAAGRRHAAAARAARPTPEAKAEAWASVVERDDLPNAMQVAVISGFMQADQPELLAPYVERYFGAIKQVYATRTNEIAQNIVVGLYPTVLASQELLDRTDAWLADPDVPAALRRLVVESRDGVARALRAQAADAAS